MRVAIPLLPVGTTIEARFNAAYTEFIFERLRHKNPDGSLQIMYTIHGILLAFLFLDCKSYLLVFFFPVSGTKDLEEIELTHLDGHKGSKPVRIGNGASDHLQLVGDSAFLTRSDR